MSSRDEQWWDLQAAEYVLGTLSEQDKVVFERLLQSDTDAKRAVAEWEQRLDPLHRTTPSVEPPAGTFHRIEERIRFDEEQASTRRKLPNVTELLEEVRFWKGAMVASLAATIAIGVSLHNQFRVPTQVQVEPVIEPVASVAELQTVTVLLNESGEPIWAVNFRPSRSGLDGEAGDANDSTIDNSQPQTIAPDSGEVFVSVIGEPALASDKSHQLWMVLADGTGVQTVGLMPNELGESKQIALPIALSDATSFAVSLEVLGGVPGPDPGTVIAINPIVTPLENF